MKDILAVSVLALTVFFLSLSVAHAGTDAPYPIYGYANNSDGTPADGALVTICMAGDSVNNTTAVVGVSYGVSGWWKADLYNIPPVSILTIGSGDIITVEVSDDASNTGVATIVVDTSIRGAHRVADVTISPSQDTTPPTITANTPTGTDVPVSAAITVTFDEVMNEASVEGAFFIDDPSVTGTTSWAGNTITFTPEGNLAYSTTYSVTIGTVAEDLAGNPLADDFTWGFTTKSAPAYPSPSITDWSNDKTNDNALTITVNESEAVCFSATADQTIDTWDWYKDGADQAHNFDNYTTSWSRNGTYSVSVNATNANGTSNMIAWTITVNDITPPAQVTGLTNDTPTTATVDLSWNANTEDDDLAGYRVYQDGSLLGSTANTDYNVAGLAASTTYEFNVSAYDDNDLEGVGASVTVTTAAYPAPTYGVVILQPVNQTTVEGVNATYLLNVTNTGNVADTYTLQVTNIDGATTAALNRTTMPLAAGASDVVALDIANTTAGTFNVTVNATSQIDPTVIFTTGYIMTTVEVAPAVATSFVILDPADGTVDAPITVTVEVHDQYGNLMSTYQDDVTLSASGSATGDGLVNIVDGTGSLDISDQVAETVDLSLDDTEGTGLDVSSTQDVVFDAGSFDHIDVTPISWTLNVSEYKDFNAIGCDQYGNSVDGVVFTWHSTKENVGTIADDGNFTALAFGTTEVYATNNSIESNKAQVTVNEQETTGNVDDGSGDATSGNSTAIVNLNNTTVNDTVTIQQVNPLNLSEVDGNTTGLGDGAKLIKGAIVTVNSTILDALVTDAPNKTSWVHIGMGYDDSELDGIDENSLHIYKWVNGTGWVKLVKGDPDYCIANDRNTTTNYVWANVTHLCTFALVGSAPAIGGTPGGTSSSGGSSSSGGGTYPPGWGEPAPTPTAAPEPTVAPTEAPTVAPTEAPTKAPTAAPTETATTEMETKGTPGFGAVLTVFAIAGLLVAAYLVMRRRE